MKHWIGELFGAELQDLSGAHMSGDIPLSDGLINRLIAKALSDSPSMVTDVVIETLDDDALMARVTIRQKYVPVLTIRAEVERQPQLPESAVFGLRWSLSGLGPLSKIAAGALELVSLPPWIRLERGMATIDIAALIAERGFAEILPHLAHLHVSTRKGQAVVTFEIRVVPGSDSGVRRSSSGSR